MKHLRLLLVLPLLWSLAACEPKSSTGDKIQNKVDDALDRRSNEKLRDAGENVKEAAEDIKDAAKDAAKDIKEGVK